VLEYLLQFFAKDKRKGKQDKYTSNGEWVNYEILIKGNTMQQYSKKKKRRRRRSMEKSPKSEGEVRKQIIEGYSVLQM
jgi:hypothetical protein